MEIKENPIYFRAFFLLVKILIEIRQNLVFKKYSFKEKFIHGTRNRFFG